MDLSDWVSQKISQFLSKEPEISIFPPCDFNSLYRDIRPCDVLLVEGFSRVSKTIKFLTHSTWSHAALCIGKHTYIKNQKLHEHLLNNYIGDKEEILLIEPVIGRGVSVSPLSKYHMNNLRLCRPVGLTQEDTTRVIDYCIGKVGYSYNLRQIFDLMRLLSPITIFPRRLFSSLYRINTEGEKKSICSSIIAEAFQSVQFPILPSIIVSKNGEIELAPRNTNLYSPKDFDYSPYFEIIKAPLFGMTNKAMYRKLPWNKKGLFSNDHENFFIQKNYKPALTVKDPVRETD